jgi:hypothetical protein
MSADDRTDQRNAPRPAGSRPGISRRSVLRGAAGAGAAGLTATVLAGAAAGPALAAGRPAAGRPAGDRHVPRDLDEGAGEDVIVHVRDVRSGELDVFSGTSHTRLRDPDLAARLVRAIS